jgi:uncharacterized membrane protein
LLTVVSSFTLAEMSDKTTLATFTLASGHNWAGVWIGSTAGMVMAGSLTIVIGRMLHQRLPGRLLHIQASLLLLLFGIWMLSDGALDSRPIAITAASATTLTAASIWLTGKALRRRRGREPTAARPPRAA